MYGYHLMGGGRDIGLIPAVRSVKWFREELLVAEHVRGYLKYFGDRVRFVFYDDLCADPADTARRVLEWLGVDPSVEETLAQQKVHSSKTPRSAFVARLAFGVQSILRKRLKWNRVAEFTKHASLVHRLLYSDTSRDLGGRADRDDAFRRLRAEFDDEVYALSELTGRDLSQWLYHSL